MKCKSNYIWASSLLLGFSCNSDIENLPQPEEEQEAIYPPVETNPATLPTHRLSQDKLE